MIDSISLAVRSVFRQQVVIHSTVCRPPAIDYATLLKLMTVPSENKKIIKFISYRPGDPMQSEKEVEQRLGRSLNVTKRVS